MTEAYPLQWPPGRPRTTYPNRSVFDTSQEKANINLMNEIKLLGGVNVVVSSNMRIRGDGLPYAKQRQPDDPGVAVYFTHKCRQVCFACDRWDLVKDNMQAIRKTIEALRGIERWGTGDMVQAAFSGFEALPPPKKREHKTWWQVLGVSPEVSLNRCEESFKRLAKRAHPDAGGSQEEMAELNLAIHQVRTLKS